MLSLEVHEATTVKTHVATLMTKTGRDNRTRLAILAVLTGTTPD